MREFEDIKIAVAGAGYVGMSIAVLLAQHHEDMRRLYQSAVAIHTLPVFDALVDDGLDHSPAFYKLQD